MTANEFTNVKDVKDIFLYTKDGYIMSYLRIHSISISLMSQEEKRSKEQPLTSSFESDRKDFVYFSIPREIDLDRYTGELKDRHRQEITNLGRRRILAELLRQANGLATSSENYEHQHYIKLWKYVGSDKGRAETELRSRVQEFKSRFSGAGIVAEILKDADILKLCNLFGNPSQAAYEQVVGNMIFEPYALL